MAVGYDRPIVCPILVGRAHALESLERALHCTTGSQGQVLLLAGEAGIGKTRLVTEAKARAARLGLAVLEGRCFEPDRSLPFGPWLDLLRTRLAGRSSDAVAHELGPAARELVKLLPELATLLPGLAPTVPLDPEQEKRRLFHALGQFFAALAAARPLLVVVEDVHWSDDTSLEFLLYFARRAAEQPMLLLLTYRGEEPHPGLGHFLAELDRERLAAELSLSGLSAAEVDAMLRAIFRFDRPIRPEFLGTIYALTEGNPFFIEELLKSLVATGDLFYVDGRWDRKPLGELRIPRSVQDAVRRRAARVSEAAREVLALSAVVGRHFDFALLQVLTQRDEEELLRLIKELIGAQLLVEASAERFAFRHALTRQAIYSELLARERRALHRRIAEALERLQAESADRHPEDLAAHFYQAGIWTKALEYAQRAGQRAQALYAPRAAIEQFGRALEAAHRLGVAPPPELFRARGRAYDIVGEFACGRADHEQALRQARDLGDRQAEWRSLIDLGFLWLGRDHQEAGRFFGRALELARALGDPATTAESLNRVGNWHVSADQPIEAQRYHEQALAIFQSSNDRRGLAATLDLLGMATHVGSDLVLSEAYYERASALFRELDDRQGLASCLFTLQLARGDSYYTDTMVPAAARLTGPLEAEEALEIARAIGWRSGEAYAHFTLSDGLATRGEYGQALARARASLEIAEEIEHRPWMTSAHLGLGVIYLELLALPLARQHLERGLVLAGEIGSPHWTRTLAAPLASTFVLQEDLAAAASILEAVLGSHPTARAMGERHALGARAELALAAGDPALALRIVDRLIATAPNLAEGRVIPRLWKLRGEALAALGRAPEAEAALLAAEGAARAQGTRRWLWRSALALGRLYRAEGRREGAEGAFAAARGIVEELAAGIPDQALRDRFLQQAAALIPSAPPLSPRQAAKQAAGGLTAREREVAALIARGKSNRAIAAELVISERTVEGHVANILAKLRFDARTQIAAWAVEKGLAGIGE